METGKELLGKAVRDLAASRTTSTTAAGPVETAAAPSPERVDVINQVFALFRLNYHNQYYKAFDDTGQLNQIKRLWLDSLAAYSTDTVLRAAKHCIETSEYLPTLHRILDCCREVRMQAEGLPDAYAAYREACLAAEPRQAQHWSHPLVYHAGRETGWFLLSSAPEKIAFPAFERHYLDLCNKLAEGVEMALPAPATVAVTPAAVLPPDDQRARLAKLREDTGI